jgi:hypothetical protein
LENVSNIYTDVIREMWLHWEWEPQICVEDWTYISRMPALLSPFTMLHIPIGNATYHRIQVLFLNFNLMFLIFFSSKKGFTMMKQCAGLSSLNDREAGGAVGIGNALPMLKARCPRSDLIFITRTHFSLYVLVKKKSQLALVPCLGLHLLLEHLYNPTAWASDVFFYVTWH